MESEDSTKSLYDSFTSFNQTGIDLTSYGNQLQRERSSRTLNLRRIKRTSISPVSAKGTQGSKPKTGRASECPSLEPSCVCSIFEKNDIGEMIDMFHNLINVGKESPSSIVGVANDENVLEAFANCLGNYSCYNEEWLILILMAITTLFPIIKNKEFFIDTGICFCFSDFLDIVDGEENDVSEEKKLIAGYTLNLIGVISEKSGYGRNSILCLGIHETIINIIIKEINDVLTNAAAEAAYRIFANPDEVEPEILIGSVELMVKALNVSSIEAINWIILSFVEMTNDYSSLVQNLFDFGLFPVVVGLLDNQSCISSSLKLVGNLCTSQPSQISVMIDAGLLPKLFSFVETEYSSDAFWVLSNLMEAVPKILLPYISHDFINRVLDITNYSSFDVKREAVFFIATTCQASIPDLVTNEIIELLIEMLGCEVSYIVIRCVSSIF